MREIEVSSRFCGIIMVSFDAVIIFWGTMIRSLGINIHGGEKRLKTFMETFRDSVPAV